jgi:hypothetical protein
MIPCIGTDLTKMGYREETKQWFEQSGASTVCIVASVFVRTLDTLLTVSGSDNAPLNNPGVQAIAVSCSCHHVCSMYVIIGLFVGFVLSSSLISLMSFHLWPSFYVFCSVWIFKLTEC